MPNSVAVVAGGGGGIGKAICDTLAEDGYDVAIWDIDEEQAREAAGIVESRG